MVTDMLNALARRVQTIVPVQPWSSRGEDPVPVEIYYDQNKELPWTVRYVSSLTHGGGRRGWSFAHGNTLEEALRKALDA